MSAKEIGRSVIFLIKIVHIMAFLDTSTFALTAVMEMRAEG